MKRKALGLLGIFLGCSGLKGAAAPAVQWDTSLYLTTVRDQLKQELEEQLNNLFAGYSRKQAAFSTTVIDDVSKMAAEVITSLDNNRSQDLLSDREFAEKNQAFKDAIAGVALALAEGAKQKSSITHKRSESNRKLVEGALEALERVKNELVSRINYLQGDASPGQQRRATMLAQQEQREAVIKKFREFVQEMRKEPKVRARTINELYGEAAVIQSERDHHLTDEQNSTFETYLEKIRLEKNDQDARENMLKGREVVLKIPFEGKPGQTVHLWHRPSETVLLSPNGSHLEEHPW